MSARIFFISHNSGDQRLYVGLAMKLGHLGMASYNLRQIALVSQGPFLIYTNSSEGRQLLGRLAAEGASYIDQPLFYHPPLFPLAIAAAHRVFAAGRPYAVQGLPPAATVLISKDVLLTQGYACVVPMLCGLLTVLCCFTLGKLLFSDAVGLLAALLVSVSPAFIQASQRIWADTTLALFVTLAFLFLYLYAERGKATYLLLSSASLALSMLTKNYGALALVPFAFTFSLVVCARQDRGTVAVALVASLLVVALLTLPWYWLSTQTLGSPWFSPRPASINPADSWAVYLKTKPWYTYLVSIPFQVPAYIFGIVTMAGLAFSTQRKIEAMSLSGWFVSFLVALTYITWHDMLAGPEARYMIPAYPALAILSALGLIKARDFLATGIGANAATVIVSLALLGSIVRSLQIAARIINFDEIDLPF